MNCWFCNQNTTVPYGNRNCWDCPNCDQYNGFQEVSFFFLISLWPLQLHVCQLQKVNSVFVNGLIDVSCCQNGDYNKPIPAQYMEHLNHGVSGGLPSSETPKTLQWVNCQMLLCRKCNNNQSIKIKQLASFIPRDDVCTVLLLLSLSQHLNDHLARSLNQLLFVSLQENYDEEIEVYKHHVEQTYKLCRPCQTAVEYYIKYQNRQLRTVLLTHQLRRSRESEKGFVKVSVILRPKLQAADKSE